MNDTPLDPYAHDLTFATWRKSSASAAEGDCVEVTDLPSGGKAIRDSKSATMAPLRLTSSSWLAFRQAVREGVTWPVAAPQARSRPTGAKR
jgi:hypothetical protein